MPNFSLKQLAKILVVSISGTLVICAGVVVYQKWISPRPHTASTVTSNSSSAEMSPPLTDEPSYQEPTITATSNEVLKMTWDGPNNVSVQAFRQLVTIATSTPGEQIILRAKTANGTVELSRYWAELNEDSIQYPAIGRIKSVKFSPLGTYVTVYSAGYESSPSSTYNMVTGEELISGAYPKRPYWTSNESKVAVIQEDASIDGTPLAIYFGSDGNPKNVVLIKEFANSYDYSLKEVAQQGEILLITIYTDTGKYPTPPKEVKFNLDLKNGSFNQTK